MRLPRGITSGSRHQPFRHERDVSVLVPVAVKLQGSDADAAARSFPRLATPSSHRADRILPIISRVTPNSSSLASHAVLCPPSLSLLALLLLLLLLLLLTAHLIHPPPHPIRPLFFTRVISDELLLLSGKKMHRFTTVDGFLNVKEGVDEMIKYLANEPSVGLFFVQQHAQTTMPYLLNVKDKVVEEIHEVTLQTEDIEDSICVVKSMTEYGLPIADEMIKDINKSLHIMSTSQPKRGLIQNPSWGFQAGRASASSQYTFNYGISSGQQSGRSSHGYLSAVFNSAKQKAAGFRWSQPGTVLKGPQSDQLVSSSTPPLSTVNIGPLSGLPDAGGEELPLSSHLSDDQLDEPDTVGESPYGHDMSSMMEIYDKFKFEREAKLEEWLQGPEDCHRFSRSGD